ncbi:MAG: cadherin-like domain-containing protein, partial [Anaerolineae bacterium]|nr:cadherin-like domain-containing protein [Anaerolineae bacterium]
MKAKRVPFIVFALVLALLSPVAETVSSQEDWQRIEGYELPVLTDDDPSVSTGGKDYPNLLVYPYLGETTTTSVVVSWATDKTGVSDVRYSLDQSYSNVVSATNSTYDGKYWHAATITGLTADTTYYYKTYTGGYDVTPWSAITCTTALESTALRLTFIALGDSRPSGESSPPSQAALDVAAEMEQHSIDLALHTGDIVFTGGICSGNDSAWNQYIRAYFDLYRQSMGHVPLYPSVGNHELYGGSCGYQGYTDVYYLPENAPSGDEEEYYSFDWGNTHFVALDTNQNYSAGSTQYNWLVNDLQRSTQPWKFVFFHHPPYSSGPHGSTNEVQTHLVPIFETYGVSVVFSGHDHHYERTCPILNNTCTTPQNGGVVYYVTGGGGAPLYPAFGDWFTAYSDSLNHFLKVEVNDCWLRVDALDANGYVFDSYEIDHCPANQPPVANDDAYSVSEGHTLTVAAPGVLANDTDADAGNTLTATLVSSTSHGTLTLDPDGSFTYAHDGSETTSDNFTYQAYDRTDYSNVATVTITINPVNDPPVAAGDYATTDEGASVVINVLSNDSDPDNDTLTIGDYDTSSIHGGTVGCTSTGVCTYTPPADFNGTDTFT